MVVAIISSLSYLYRQEHAKVDQLNTSQASQTVKLADMSGQLATANRKVEVLKSQSKQDESSASNAKTVYDVAEEVVGTNNLSGEQKAVQDMLTSFYSQYYKASDQASQDKLTAAHLTAEAQADVKKPSTINNVICHQYRPMLIVGLPAIKNSSADVTMQPVDIIDMYSEKPYQVSLVKQNNTWLIDSITCTEY